MQKDEEIADKYGHDKGSLRPNRSTDAHQNKRPFGRSFQDFLNQETKSGLLPAEERLLTAVAKGDRCDVSSYENRRELREELRKANSNPAVVELASEIIASAVTFRRRLGETTAEREARERLEASIKELPRIVREFLSELPDFVESFSSKPKDLSERVSADRDLLRPILEKLKEQIESEIDHWRQVDHENQILKVRADFLRFLSLGGDEATPVHEKGVQLCGVFVAGKLDMADCVDVHPLELDNCVFSNSINLRNARLRRLSLYGCKTSNIDALRCKIEGSLVIDDGFCGDSVFLVGATIGGALDCSGSKFRGGLDCTNTMIGSDVYLSSGFKATDKVSFVGATIGGDLSCINGQFFNQAIDDKGVALSCEGVKIAGEVFLGPDFIARGAVNFSRAEVSNFWARGGIFENLVHSQRSTKMYSTPDSPMAADALDLSVCKIAHALVLGPSYSDPSSAAKINGVLDLEGAVARLLVDHRGSWPEKKMAGKDGQLLTCAINLNGFIYERLAHIAPAHALDAPGMKGRLDWLLRQPPRHLHDSFRPQPFEQLIKVLREMGHEKDAQQIALAKQRISRRAKARAIWREVYQKPQNWREWIHAPVKFVTDLLAIIGLLAQWLVLDLLLGGGYAKARPLLIFFAVLFGCAWYYHFAADQSGFVPTNPVLYNDPEIRKACAGTKETPDVSTSLDWYHCKRPPAEFNPFRPLLYSVELMVPVIQMGQKRDWQPISKQLRIRLLGLNLTVPRSTTLVVTWSQTISSLLLYLLIAAILTGLVKRD